MVFARPVVGLSLNWLDLDLLTEDAFDRTSRLQFIWTQDCRGLIRTRSVCTLLRKSGVS